MPTLTTTEQVLYQGPAATVTIATSGAVPAWIRWEGRLEQVAQSNPPLAIATQGRTIYGATKSGTTDVTVTLGAPGHPEGGSGVTVDGGTP